jgi:hypothetical protein
MYVFVYISEWRRWAAKGFYHSNGRVSQFADAVGFTIRFGVVSDILET